jgi:hypothetical protein
MFTDFRNSFWASRNRRLARIASTVLSLALTCVISQSVARAANNPGDPLYCQPQEGTTFLIVNGGTGIFTADADCFNSNIANDTQNSIATSQGGTLTKNAGTGDYVYAPPTANFTGLDTFTFSVTTVWNGAGGTGSAGGTARPGGPATFTITLNVIPASTTLTTSGAAMPVPVPAGSVAGCSAAGNAGIGPAPGAVYGCVTGITKTANPSHGTLTGSGNSLLYTPTPGYYGPDSFSYDAVGVNNDGPSSLDSGPVTVAVTVNAPTAGTPLPPTWSLLLLGIACLVTFESLRRIRRAPQQ